ncbi:hypothetical protein [Brevibacterium sediminis]|uniref:Uncharacterized protein n=1 Tax=Brevibacterium sediminis TaxID=1857024 RepID=A0A5C4X303_9MICO|nr:hypothetical protein [Brevibacterium sediminis]TNM55937.1 hypothetical protein FHQ09_06795 [Brevibacterium sediminis]
MAKGNKGNKKPRLAPVGGWPTGRKTAVPAERELSESAKQVPRLDIDHDEINERRPVWRFADLDDDGPWALSECGSADLKDILSKLNSFEKMKVGEIFASGSEHGKKYSLDSLGKEARNRLVEIEKDDETQIVRLRFSGKARFYGFLREHVFHVLWWDPEHEVVPSSKKNT